MRKVSYLNKRYTASYAPGVKREIAKKHIKKLLEGGKKISIYDRYLCARESQTVNKKLLLEILPRQIPIQLFVSDRGVGYDDKVNNDEFVKQIMEIDSAIKLKWKKIIDNQHDRLIKTDKIEILVSSGLYFIEKHDRDMTYSINI